MKKFLVALSLLLLAGGLFADATPDTYFAAVRRGDDIAVKAYLDSGRAKINDQDTDGMTAIMIAVDNQDLKMVLALVGYKPDPAVTTGSGANLGTISVSKANMQINLELTKAGLIK